MKKCFSLFLVVCFLLVSVGSVYATAGLNGDHMVVYKVYGKNFKGEDVYEETIRRPMKLGSCMNAQSEVNKYHSFDNPVKKYIVIECRKPR